MADPDAAEPEPHQESLGLQNDRNLETISKSESVMTWLDNEVNDLVGELLAQYFALRHQSVISAFNHSIS